jgi:tRNA modification GTPase
VSTLLQARTAAAADSALAGLRGGVGALVSELRQKTIELLGEVEVRGPQPYPFLPSYCQAT